MIPARSQEFPEKPGSLLIEGALTGEGLIDIFVSEEGIIGAAGPDAGRKFRAEADYLIDGTRSVALPGLVNTHTHAAMTLLRGFADDMPLRQWLSEKIWPLEAHVTGDDVYWGTRLACLEMILGESLLPDRLGRGQRGEHAHRLRTLAREDECQRHVRVLLGRRPLPGRGIIAVPVEVSGP